MDYQVIGLVFFLQRIVLGARLNVRGRRPVMANSKIVKIRGGG